METSVEKIAKIPKEPFIVGILVGILYRYIDNKIMLTDEV